MHASPLRQLVRRYAAGNMSRDDYLAQRRSLINAYAGGKHIDYHSHRPIVLIRGPYWLRPLVFAAIGLMIIFIGVLLWLPDTPSREPSTATTTSQPAAKSGAGAQLLSKFLSTQDWSPTNMEKFQRDWLALSEFERERARDSLWHRRLVAKTQQKLREIEALQAINPDPQLGLQKEKLRHFLKLLQQPLSTPGD